MTGATRPVVVDDPEVIRTAVSGDGVDTAEADPDVVTGVEMPGVVGVGDAPEAIPNR